MTDLYPLQEKYGRKCDYLADLSSATLKKKEQNKKQDKKKIASNIILFIMKNKV